ncbi:hypothetical protein [Rathayibacter tanaceti]|uniref:Uncharacterized protein n=1 Tax=Rathayibacter tanaceti TaxID=1671680 RepID=A0AAE6RJZ4_9MICO|nr:hypothetical protein [Rathayibacter tanaceti]QHC55065.1 hypothetical protein GSU10_05050 [Rathayibacter tanaceti]
MFTASPADDIVIEGPTSLRQRMQLWKQARKLVINSDGETLADGTQDPDADLTFAQRNEKAQNQNTQNEKAQNEKAQNGVGPEPSITLLFRLAADLDLGIVEFRSSSWGLARELAAEDVDGTLTEADGPSDAVLGLEEVSFVAENGPVPTSRSAPLRAQSRTSARCSQHITDDANRTPRRQGCRQPKVRKARILASPRDSGPDRAPPRT